MSLSQPAGSLGTLYVTIRARFNRLNSDMKKAETGLAGISGVAMNVGAALTKYVTVPIIALGAVGYASAAEIGKGYMLAARHLGYTGEKLEELKVRFRKVWREVPEGSEVIAGVLINVEQKFDLAGAAADKMTKRMLDFARVTGAEPVEASRNFGMWLQQNNIHGNKQVKVLDRLTMAHQKTGIPMEKLLTNLNQMSKMLQGLGYDYKEQISLLAKLEKGGYDLGNATEGLRMAQVKMAKEGFKDGETAMKSFIDRIKGAPTHVDAVAQAVDIFGSQAGPKMAEAIRSGVFDLEDWNAKLDKSSGTLNKTGSETEQLSDKIKILGKKILGLFEPIGKVFIFALEDIVLPALTRWANKMDKVVDSMDESGRGSEELREKYARLGTALIGLAAAGPIIWIIGGIGHQFARLGASASWVGSQVLFLGKTLGAIAGVGTLGGIGLVIAAILAIAAAIYFTITYWSELKRAFNTGLGLGAFGQVLHAFRDILAPVLANLKTAVSQLKNAFAELWKLIGPDVIIGLEWLAIAMGVQMVGAISGFATVLTLLIGTLRILGVVVVSVGRMLLGLGKIAIGVITRNKSLMIQGGSDLAQGVINMGVGIRSSVLDTATSLKSIAKASGESILSMVGATGAIAHSEGKKHGKKAGGAFNNEFSKEAKKTKVQKTAEIATELRKISRKDIEDAKEKLKMIVDAWSGIKSDIKNINVESINTGAKLVKLFDLISRSLIGMREVFDNLPKNKAGALRTKWMDKIKTALRKFIELANNIEKLLLKLDLKPDNVAKIKKISSHVNAIVGQIGYLYNSLYGNLLTPQPGGKPPMLETGWMGDVREALRRFIKMANNIDNLVRDQKMSKDRFEKIRGIALTINQLVKAVNFLYNSLYGGLLTPQGGGKPPMLELDWMFDVSKALRKFITMANAIENQLLSIDLKPGNIVKVKTMSTTINSIVDQVVHLRNMVRGKLLDQDKEGKFVLNTGWMDKMKIAVKTLITKAEAIQNRVMDAKINPETIIKARRIFELLRTVVIKAFEIQRLLAGKEQNVSLAIVTNLLTSIQNINMELASSTFVAMENVKSVFRSFGVWLTHVPGFQVASLRLNDVALRNALTPAYNGLINNIKAIFNNFGSAWLMFIPQWHQNTLRLQAPAFIPNALSPFYRQMTEHIKNILRSFSSNWLVHIPEWFHNTIVSTAEHWMGEAGRTLATKLIDAVKERLGIHSPSSAFKDIGKFMILGMVEGLGFDQVMNVMGHAFSGFMGFAFDLYNFMTQNMGRGWEWLTEYLGVDQVEILYQKLQELFALMAGPGLMAWIFSYIQDQIPGNQVLTSGNRPGSTVAGSGRQSLHATGQAIDMGGENLDAVAGLSGKIIGAEGWGSGVLKTPFGEALWKTMTGGNHFDHVHLGVTGISPFLASIMPKGGFGGGGGDVQAQLAAAATAKGWGGQIGSLMQLIQRESGFNPAAANPSSSAYGLFQMLTETSPDVGTQIRNGMNYIAGRYGNPDNAWNFWQGHNWYKGGGEVSATLHHGERVLTAQQNRWFSGLATPLGNLTSGDGAAKLATKVNVTFPSGTRFKIVNLREGMMEVVDEGIDDLVREQADIDDWVGSKE